MTPEEWRDSLNKRLDARRPTIVHFERYYEGEHRLHFATQKFREAFGDIFNGFADNWCGVVVDASVERLEVQGFRFGEEEDADEEAWRIWQANGLDAAATIGHEEAIATGYSYLLVAPGEDDETPQISIEDPKEVIVATVPGTPHKRAAAFKKWVDEDGIAMATLYLPEGIWKWRTKQKYRGGSKPTWVRREDTDDDGFDGDNPLGEVPVIPLLNRPTIRGEGRSDIRSVIPEQDAVNKTVVDMLVASEFAGYRQRWAAGIEVERDPETGEPKKKVFDPGVDRMFTTANEQARFGSFDVSNLENYVKAVEMLVQHIAAQTRTPPHYLLGQSGSFPSGESLKSTETGLVAKARRKMLPFGETYEEAMRLAFRLKGDVDKAAAIDAETIWRDPESRSEGELVDGLVKLKSIGVPRKALWERLGASPQQIQRWETMADQEALQAAASDFARVFGPGGQGVPPDVPGAGDFDAAATA